MKDNDTQADAVTESQELEGIDADGAEMIKTADQPRVATAEDQKNAYRTWRCNGVTIGLRILKKPP